MIKSRKNWQGNLNIGEVKGKFYPGLQNPTFGN
jgi:hypothetical protein